VQRDRLDAEIDHEVNVRAELAIQGVDERIEALEKKLENYCWHKTRSLKITRIE
jgi:uncharacterized membrane protein